MAELAKDSVIRTAAPFVELMFNHLWRRRPEQPTSAAVSNLPMKAAVSLLMESAKLSHDYLAKRMFITPPQLNYIVMRGSPLKVEYADRLTLIAKEFGILELHKYFDYQANLIRRKSRRQQRERDAVQT